MSDTILKNVFLWRLSSAVVWRGTLLFRNSPPTRPKLHGAAQIKLSRLGATHTCTLTRSRSMYVFSENFKVGRNHVNPHLGLDFVTVWSVPINSSRHVFEKHIMLQYDIFVSDLPSPASSLAAVRPHTPSSVSMPPAAASSWSSHTAWRSGSPTPAPGPTAPFSTSFQADSIVSRSWLLCFNQFEAFDNFRLFK